MKVFNKLACFANILLVLLTFGAYVAPYVHPDTSVIIATLGLVYSALLIANVLFVIYWLLVNPKWAIGSFLTLLIGYQTVLGLVGISFNNPSEEKTPTLSVASFNMQLSMPLRMIRGKERSIKEKEYEKYLSQFGWIDVLCLQEHSRLGQKHLEAALNFPYKHYSTKNNFVALYSKFPIINKGNIENFSKSNASDCIWADIVVQKDTIRVYSAHFEANRKDGKIPKKVVLNKKEPPVDYSIAIGLLTFYQKFSSKRVTQAQLIKAHQKNSPYPSIICGDVNDTSQSHVYKILADGQTDSFRSRGKGMGATFGSTLKNKLAFLRIDYIFSDPSFSVLNHHIFANRFSDHALIETSLRLE